MVATGRRRLLVYISKYSAYSLNVPGIHVSCCGRGAERSDVVSWSLPLLHNAFDMHSIGPAFSTALQMNTDSFEQEVETPTSPSKSAIALGRISRRYPRRWAWS